MKKNTLFLLITVLIISSCSNNSGHLDIMSSVNEKEIIKETGSNIKFAGIYNKRTNETNIICVEPKSFSFDINFQGSKPGTYSLESKENLLNFINFHIRNNSKELDDIYEAEVPDFYKEKFDKVMVNITLYNGEFIEGTFKGDFFKSRDTISLRDTPFDIMKKERELRNNNFLKKIPFSDTISFAKEIEGMKTQYLNNFSKISIKGSFKVYIKN